MSDTVHPFLSFVQDGGDPELTGSPTEKAILSWGLKVLLLKFASLFSFSSLFN
jgi:hypothetical protein